MKKVTTEQEQTLNDLKNIVIAYGGDSREVSFENYTITITTTADFNIEMSVESPASVSAWNQNLDTCVWYAQDRNPSSAHAITTKALAEALVATKASRHHYQCVKSGNIIHSLTGSFTDGIADLKPTARLLQMVQDETLYQDFVVASTDQQAGFSTFEEFLVAPIPNGLGLTQEKIDQLKELIEGLEIAFQRVRIESIKKERATQAPEPIQPGQSRIAWYCSVRSERSDITDLTKLYTTTVDKIIEDVLDRKIQEGKEPKILKCWVVDKIKSQLMGCECFNVTLQFGKETNDGVANVDTGARLILQAALKRMCRRYSIVDNFICRR